MDLLHLVEYGPAFGIFFMLEVVNQLTGFVFLGIYFTMLLVYYRQKVRQVFGMQNYGTCAGILEDWLCLCFCMPCTIAQEAQHVKFAADMGFPVPACMAEFAGQRQHLSSPVLTAGLLLDDDECDPDTSSSQEFQDVISKISGSVRNSPAISQTSPIMVFGGLFHQTGSRTSSRGMASRVTSRQQGGRNHNGIRGTESGASGRASRGLSRSNSGEFLGDRSHHIPAAKPKSLSHAASPSSGAEALALERKGRNSWHREAQNPMPERLLAQAPVRAGAPGEVRPDRLNFRDVLVTLHDDLRAYVFIFVEVGCVGRCGATCRDLHGYIWADRAFWQFYCGPSVNDLLAQPWACPAHALREAFRRWIFHIDGVWTKDFRTFVDQARQSPTGRPDFSLMLSYARYVASGLMPYDSRPAVAEFSGIMCELLSEYNPERPEERNAAEAMTAQVECMAEVFTGVQIKLILSAFDCSLGRAVSAVPSEPESDVETAFAIPGDQEIAGGIQAQPAGDPVEPPWGDHAILWFG